MNMLTIKKQASTQPSGIYGHTHAGVCVDINTDIRQKETASLMLYDNGMIRSCNQAGGDLFGCSASELIGQPIIRFLPQLAKTKLVHGKQANSYLHFLSRMGHHFEALRMNETSFTCELIFNDVTYLDQHYIRLIVRPIK